MQSIQYGLKIITIVKMFLKCYENPVKIKIYKYEKNVIACSCFPKINKVYKKSVKNLLIMFF